MSVPRNSRLTDLALRILAGEAIDWDAAMREDPAIVAELRRIQMVVNASGDSTGTAEPPPQTPDAPPRKSREDRYIGDFRLVRTLGEGGMGVVYEAEQQHPRRPVALKVIRGGQHVGHDALKLFQRESQTLARLRHPGIAALYETGVTGDGLHFFAMELVRGESLIDWLKKRPEVPSPEEVKIRLAVFKKICDAVAYAHQRGVIHRDLKPGNVLIPKETAGASFQDPVPNVKVLDFGLARITDSDVQATTYVTEMGKVQGTLPYMSPEQVRGNPDEIDQRTDVYSLGVILYQMMTGRLPYDLSKAQLPDAVRIICEEAPRSISATFSGTKRLDADVTTIAGKTLEKDPARRYQSVAALSEDVGRYLSDQPILARPPSTTYQLRKLVARHKGPFAFAATVFALVAALAVTSTVQAVRISKERDRANQEAETAKQVSGFLEDLFKVSDPSESRGSTITAREILDRGAERIEKELEAQPVTRARLLEVIANVYVGLGLMERARAPAERALAIREELEGKDGPHASDLLNLLGVIDWSRGQYGRALDKHRRALALRTAALSENDPALAKPVFLVGEALAYTGAWPESERMLKLAFELASRPVVSPAGAASGPASVAERRSRLRIAIADGLAFRQVAQDRHAEAERWYRQAAEIAARELPPDDLENINCWNNLGFVLGLQGRPDEARPFLERALAATVRSRGEEHRETANTLHSLGELERVAGHPERALPIFARARGIAERTTGSDSPLVAMILTSQAPALADTRQLAEAEAAYRRLLGIRQQEGKDGDKEVAEVLEGLSKVLRQSGRNGEAAPLEARAAVIRREVGPGTGMSFHSGGGYSVWKY